MSHHDDGADLRATMHDALRDVHAPADHATAAIASGRRLRTRQRVTYGAVGLAAVAAIGAVSVPFAGGPGEARDTAPYADTTSSRAPGDILCSSSGGASVDHAGWWDMPRADMRETLESLLPDDVTLVTDEVADGYLDGTLEGTDSTGSVQLMLKQPVTDGVVEDGVTICGEPRHVERVTCDHDPDWTGEDVKCRYLHDADGSQVGVVATHLDRGTTYHNAWLLGPDGGALSFYIANSAGEKPGYEEPTGEDPPLTFGQVRRLVQDPAWTSHQP